MPNAIKPADAAATKAAGVKEGAGGKPASPAATNELAAVLEVFGGQLLEALNKSNVNQDRLNILTREIKLPLWVAALATTSYALAYIINEFNLIEAISVFVHGPA